MVDPSTPARGFSRRGFLGLAAAGAAASPLLAACGGGSSGSGSSSSKTLKFWDMPWGVASYNAAGKKLVTGYKPSSGLPSASYQVIQWANFVQTFSSAIASKTGPAVSTGGGFQAFQFATQGAIAYADDLVASLKKDGTYDDFLPGTVEAFKTSDGYVAIPWQLDMRVWWYRKSLLDQAGAKVPTSWDEVLSAGQALKKIGVYGFGAGSGSGNNIGSQAIFCMMLNNGGGLFDADGTLDVMNTRNVETVDFIRQLAGEGITDPAMVGYTIDNDNSAWKNKKYAMGINTAGLDGNVGDTTGDLLVMSPLAGPHGDKGTLMYLNNIMMYKNTPSQKGSEAFLSWYLKNIKTYWEQNVNPSLPVQKSVIAVDAFQKQTQKVKVIDEWQPVGKTIATKQKVAGLPEAKIDANNAMFVFAQSVLGGKTDTKTALTTLSNSLTALLK